MAQLKKTHEVNLQLAKLSEEATKACVFQHITYGALILVAQLYDHICIDTLTSANVTIYNKQIKTKMK